MKVRQFSENDQFVNQFYDNYLDFKADWTGEISADHEAYYDKIDPLMALPPGSSLLEIGFGDGQFLSWSRKHSYNITGMEIQPPLLERMEKQGFSVISGPLTSQSLSGRMFDVIAAFDVLEHLTVHEILDLLLNSRDHLKPDGFYLFQFPNMASPFGMIHQHGDVTHETPLSVSVIDQIARTTGFRVTTTLRPRPYPQRTMAKMRRLLGYALQAVIEIVISHAYFGGAAHLEPNALVVLQRKPD